MKMKTSNTAILSLGVLASTREWNLMIEERLKHYLEKQIPARDQYIEQMEREAHEQQVPIMDLLGMESLLHLLKMAAPARILEIGTAIGYSAIRMAQALPEATIVSIERDERRYEEAHKHVKALGLESRIELLFGDALQLGEKLELYPLFDVLFIDAAKGQYRRFFDMYSPMVRPGGLILSDNVLFRGLVAETDIEHKRHKQLATKIDTYNQWLLEHPQYDTRIFPVGDGIAISIKRETKGDTDDEKA
jgi:predicted O-methyltransferase YrrM